MKVIHVLKDGSQHEDITGHIVQYSDATAVYQIIDSLNKRLNKKSNT